MKKLVKKKLVFLAVAAAAVQANAGVKFDARAEWHNRGSYQNKDNVEQRELSQYEIFRARLAMSGKLGDDLVGNIRLDLLKDATVSKDGSNGILNYAFITHKVTDEFAINAGKIWLKVGGIETIYSGADLYFISLAAIVQRQNLTGASVDITPVANSVISVYSVNNDDTTSNNQQRMGYGLAYKGTFMDGSATAVGNFTSTFYGPEDATKGRTLAAVGGQYKPMTDLAFDLGYVNNVDKDSLPGKDTITTSYVTQVKYVVDHWSPSVKAELSNVDTGVDTTSFDRTRIGAAIEFKPHVDKYFRYHVAWDTLSDKFKAESLANRTVTQSQVFVGMRLVTDIL